MIRAASGDIAKKDLELIKSKGTGELQWRTQYIGTPRTKEIGAEPQAFLVDLPPDRSIVPHFHQIDQYQVFVAGTGSLGRNAVPLIALHYVDRNTAYRPVNSGPVGLSFFTIRARSDSGPVYLHDPQHKSFLRPSKKRYLLTDNNLRGVKMLLRYAISTVMFGASLLGANIAASQSYPSKPIRVLVGGIGGSSDVSLRLMTPALSSSLGQQVVVDNRPSSLIPGEIVARAAPDGYTLLFAGGVFAIAPLLQKSPYDPVKDFAPLSIVTSSPHILVVNPAVAANSVRELIALAKAKPRGLNYGAVGIGASSHLAAELFKAMAGVDIVHVNYKGGGMALNDLIGGQIQLQFATASSVMPHVKSGKLRALAVTSAQPTTLAPGLPTVAASGVPGYESGTIYSMYAPAATPARIINQLNREIVRALSSGDVREKLFSLGAEPVGSSPEQLAAAMKSEIVKLGKVIKDAGIRGE